MIEGRILVILFLAFVSYILYQSYNLKIGTFFSPGPGFLPFFSSLLLGFLSVLLLFMDKTPIRFYWRRPIFTFFIILLYSISLEMLGFVLSTSLLMWVLLILTGQKKLKAIIYSLSFSFLSFLLFKSMLKVPLPGSRILGF